jgi:Uma2 family endonuclease
VQASWAHFVALAEEHSLQQAKFYYDRGWLRIEMSPVGPAHARDNSLLAQIVGVFVLRSERRVESYVAPSLRRSGMQEAQPDLAFYVDQKGVPSLGTRPIDLETAEPPALVVEVSATTLDDDLTAKRRLYVQMGVAEYWVVDVKTIRVHLFTRSESGEELAPAAGSEVLPGLTPGILEEALRLGRARGDAAALRYIQALPG